MDNESKCSASKMKLKEHHNTHTKQQQKKDTYSATSEILLGTISAI